MTDPDRRNIRLVTDAVAREIKPRFGLPLTPDEEIGTAFDRDCRDVLARIERSLEDQKRQEAER